VHGLVELIKDAYYPLADKLSIPLGDMSLNVLLL
jgi:hypothetical protein